MEIKIHPHTLERAVERGTSEDEIKDVIRHGIEIAAKQGRLAKAKVYDYQEERLGKYYEQKRVEVIYTVEEEVVVTVTVYVFYEKWG